MLEPAALLFDMDGLMVDSEPLWFEVERDFARARGGDWTVEAAQGGAGGGLARALARIGKHLGQAIEIDVGVAELVERFIVRLPELRLKPGLPELVAAARGVVPIALASSNVRRLVDAVLARFELSDTFDATVAGDEVPQPKPAPDVFLEAARRLGVEAGRCVVLEDALAGVAAARAAGMAVIAVPEHWPHTGYDGVATVVVRDLFEARRHLQLGADRLGE
ncbi:MAG: HAD family phosphatase [Myxococcota bacterium]